MKPKFITKICKHHGETEYVLEPCRDSYRCKKCRSKHVDQRRRNLKTKIVKEFGNKCSICGYNKCIAALEFHHLNPNEKMFGIGSNGLTRSYKKLLEEAKKCILVCANCHREIENNVTTINMPA